MTNIDGHSKPKPGGIRKSQIHLGPRINVPHYLYTLRGIQSAENNIQFGIDCPFALFSQPVCAISRSQITEATMDAEKLEPVFHIQRSRCSGCSARAVTPAVILAGTVRPCTTQSGIHMLYWDPMVSFNPEYVLLLFMTVTLGRMLLLRIL